MKPTYSDIYYAVLYANGIADTSPKCFNDHYDWLFQFANKKTFLLFKSLLPRGSYPILSVIYQNNSLCRS